MESGACTAGTGGAASQAARSLGMRSGTALLAAGGKRGAVWNSQLLHLIDLHIHLEDDRGCLCSAAKWERSGMAGAGSPTSTATVWLHGPNSRCSGFFLPCACCCQPVGALAAARFGCRHLLLHLRDEVPPPVLQLVSRAPASLVAECGGAAPAALSPVPAGAGEAARGLGWAESSALQPSAFRGSPHPLLSTAFRCLGPSSWPLFLLCACNTNNT